MKTNEQGNPVVDVAGQTIVCKKLKIDDQSKSATDEASPSTPPELGGVAGSVFSFGDTRQQLLAVLVLDLGYTKQPLYGHTPMRHQFAWDMATNGMTDGEIGREVVRLLHQQGRERAQNKQISNPSP